MRIIGKILYWFIRIPLEIVFWLFVGILLGIISESFGGNGIESRLDKIIKKL